MSHLRMRIRRLIFLVLVAWVALARSAGAQVPGCVNGTLLDPSAYVRSLEAGFPPSQWPAAMAAMQPKLAHVGIDVQHGSGGNLRPRLFLPTHQPPFVPDGDFNHTVDLIKTDSSGTPIEWEWVDYGGGYAPYACPGASPPPPPPPPVPPPSTELAARVTAAEDQLSALNQAVGAIAALVASDAATTQARLTKIESLQGRPIPVACKAAANFGAFRIPTSCTLVLP